MTGATRREKDLLGEKEISSKAYYGIQTARALENFPITGLKPHKGLIVALAMVKKAAALANMELGTLSSVIGGAIVQAADEVIQGDLQEEFVVDVIQGGAGTSMNMNANEVLANRAIEILGGQKGDYRMVHPNNHVNMAQSTNDVFPTAIRIAALYLGAGLLEKLETMAEVCKDLAQRFDQVIKMGRTHLQDAVPIRLGQEFAAYGCMLARDRERIKRALESLLEINMGATAVGTGLNADPYYIERVTFHLREISGFSLKRAANLVDATQNADVYVEVSGQLKTLAVNLSKLANDLRLMASGPRTGLGEINLPPVQPGSSIMPGKVNPVMAEVVNQVAFQVMGNDLTITRAAEAGQLELNVMEPVLTYNLLQSLDILRNSIDVFTSRCLTGITANVECCRQMVERSVGPITAINPHVGHEVASQVAREALATGRSIREIILERGILTPEELAVILDLYEMTEPGIAGKDLLRGR
ncbi:MAG: aspartate ammonia-lyase [Clostridia bacterium]|nr:aspartate ammonia-lyase [Clostridia bacterium]